MLGRLSSRGTLDRILLVGGVLSLLASFVLFFLTEFQVVNEDLSITILGCPWASAIWFGTLVISR